MNDQVAAKDSLDGTGCGDHDQPYRFFRPSTEAPFPFTTRQYARLLVMRSRVNVQLLAPLDRAG